ncbi:DUF4326 domain-containing protein [Devosia sp.]|uniref:DUF4326 domain-containing protein n=1 Tax=Devosia sp. TaxID=1871048 RepID=UPI0032639332
MRIVLSRGRGFNLQAQSRALNGLPAQSVSRPGRWGNPFVIAEIAEAESIDAIAAQVEAVSRFERWMNGTLAPELSPGPPLDRAEIRRHLAGRNLACWCKQGTPCHANILIDIANGK